MGRLFTPPSPLQDDLMTVVGTTGIPYHCPDRGAFDDHLAQLRARLHHARRFPELLQIFRADIDRLLDCRDLLAMLAAAAEPPPAHPRRASAA
jgi:hypothetical protein